MTPAPLFADPLALDDGLLLPLAFALGLPDACENVTLSEGISKPVVVEARVMAVPFLQTELVPDAPSVKFTPAH
jgi:hypothetical protein